MPNFAMRIPCVSRVADPEIGERLQQVVVRLARGGDAEPRARGPYMRLIGLARTNSRRRVEAPLVHLVLRASAVNGGTSRGSASFWYALRQA